MSSQAAPVKMLVLLLSTAVKCGLGSFALGQDNLPVGGGGINGNFDDYSFSHTRVWSH